MLGVRVHVLRGAVGGSDKSSILEPVPTRTSKIGGLEAMVRRPVAGVSGWCGVGGEGCERHS
jgi:hypothetical protein